MTMVESFPNNRYSTFEGAKHNTFEEIEDIAAKN